MPKHTGTIVWNENKGYGVFCRGEYAQLTEELTDRLMDDVHITIKDLCYNNTYEFKGILHIKKTGKLHRFYVGEECIDDLLWDLATNRTVSRCEVTIDTVRELILADNLEIKDSGKALRNDLKDFREDEELTVKDMAQMIEVSEATYSNYENGKGILKQDKLKNLDMIISMGAIGG